MPEITDEQVAAIANAARRAERLQDLSAWSTVRDAFLNEDHMTAAVREAVNRSGYQDGDDPSEIAEAIAGLVGEALAQQLTGDVYDELQILVDS